MVKIPKKQLSTSKKHTPVPDKVADVVAAVRKERQQKKIEQHNSLKELETGRFQKGHAKVPGSGRPKGAIGNFTAAIREAFLTTFKDLGEARGLTAWASYSNENMTEYYKLLARLTPKDIQVSSRDGDGVQMNYLENVKEVELDEIIGSCVSRIK